jgi:tetratricopeptide (TPR) repeat protein
MENKHMADTFISRNYSSPDGKHSGTLDEAFFERLLEEAEKGERHVLLLGGKPGMGKRRAVRELEKLCEARDIGFYQGRCVSDLKPPLDPFLQIVRGYSASTMRKIGDIMGQNRVLNTLLGERGFRAIEAEDPNRPFLDEGAVLWSFLTFFRKVSSKKTMLCFLEDLQWLDDSSMMLLKFLNGHLKKEKLLFIATYSGDEQRHGENKTAGFHQFKTDLAGSREAMDITIEPLDYAGCRSLIMSVFNLDTVPDAYIHGIQQRCSGNPMHIIESLKYLRAYERIEFKEGTLKGDPDHMGRLPASLFDTILDSAVTLPESQKELYRTAACMGISFSFEMLRRALGRIPEESLREALDRGQKQGFLQGETIAGETRLVFSHHLIRDVFYDLIPQYERKELHGRIGQLIEEICFDRLAEHYEELVMHFTRALNDDRTIRYLIRAADKSALRGAYPQAIGLYQRALGLLVGSLEKSKELWKCYRNSGVLYVRTGAPQMALTYQKKALDLAEKKIDTLAIQECLFLIADLYLAEGDRKRSLAMVEKGLAYETMKDSIWRAKLLSRRGTIARLYRYKERTFEDALLDLMEALEIARELRNIDATIEMSELIADHYSEQNMIEEAAQILEKTLIYRTDIRTRLHLLDKLGSLLLFPGSDYRRALSLFLEGFKSASVHDDEVHRSLFANYLGSLYSQTGEPRMAERYLRKALAVSGEREAEAETRLLLGQLAYYRGMFSKAQKHCNEADRLLGEGAGGRLPAEMEILRGNCALLADDLEGAHTHFKKAKKSAGDAHYFKGAFFALLGLSEIYLREGNLFSARRLFVEASHMNKGGENRFGGACLMVLQGIGFRLDNNPSQSISLLSRAEELVEKLGRTYDLGFLCLEKGRSYLISDGDDVMDAAMKCFLKSEECFTRIGNSSMAHKVRDEWARTSRKGKRKAR